MYLLLMPVVTCRPSRGPGFSAAPNIGTPQDAGDADAVKDDGIWIGERMVGFVTSGAYGHHVDKSLALAYVDTDVAESQPELTVSVVGEPLSARILPEVPYDPKGARLREATA